MKADEFEAITETIRHRSYDDRALIPDCFQHALDTLGVIARTGDVCTCPLGLNVPRDPDCPVSHEDDQRCAEQALRRMVLRAESGVPFDEPPHVEEHL